MEVIIPYVLGFFSAIIPVFIKLRWDVVRDKKLRLLKLVSIMEAIEAELNHYRNTLNTLDQLLGDAFQVGSDRRLLGLIVPSFPLLPEFLAGSKKELLGHFEVGACLPILVDCHFELCHIQSKLLSFQNLVQEQAQFQILQSNRDSLRGLVHKNVDVFRNAAASFHAQIIVIKEMLCDLEDNSLFGSLLREL